MGLAYVHSQHGSHSAPSYRMVLLLQAWYVSYVLAGKLHC